MKLPKWAMGAALGAALVGGYFYFTASPAPQNTAGGPMINVTEPTLDRTAEAGKMVFNKNCASCHGQSASGKNGLAPPLIHKIYEPGHHGDGAFFRAVRAGVRQHHWTFGNMPAIEGLSDQEIALIIRYVRTVQSANGIF
ncbi:c-type cytochrome [Sneathiella chinensis]|uniref:Cytochrome c domain-containing protein n=1 Tax=Sneathiella chinensis TaxID=349750 RepID=A0ABQ5U1P8_9PROT|nr:cytochrome c [Sneathiella chinensis]GLQ06052.1 hypothetical protein GCM10007924_12730 [Sneathiella chinensis]